MTIKRVKEKLSAALRGDERWIGRGYVLLSTLCFGSIATFAKLAYQSGIASSELLALRFLAAAAVLWAYFLIFRRDLIRIGFRQLAVMAALGLAGYGIQAGLVFTSLETVPAATASLLFFSYPVFALSFEWLTRRERPEVQLLFGAALMIVGIAIGAFGVLRSVTTGVLLAVAAGAWYGAYVVATRRLLNNQKPQTVALYVISFAALGFWLTGGTNASRLMSLSGQAWVAVLWLGVVATVIAVLAFYAGLEKLGSAAAAQIGGFELVVTVSLAGIALGEPITMPIVTGAAFILLGILMGQMRPRRKPAMLVPLRGADVRCWMLDVGDAARRVFGVRF